MPFLNVNAIKIHYQISGDGPWLTIIGGLGDTVHNWAVLALPLARHFKVLLLDNRGAGQSDRPSGPYRVETFASDVLAAWQELGIAKSHVLGFSMGGKVAMHLAVHHPHTVDKLILVATAAAGEKAPYPTETDIKTMLGSFANTAEHFARQFDVLFSERHKKKFSAQNFVTFKMNEKFPQTPADFAAQLAAVRDFDMTGEVHHITQPTLIISGTEDRMASYKNSEWLKDNIPNAKLALYPEVGHIPQAEESKRFLNDVSEFLLSVSVIN
jgi:pimeloyl-ACP methyl ester carboxylesterase